MDFLPRDDVHISTKNYDVPALVGAAAATVAASTLLGFYEPAVKYSGDLMTFLGSALPGTNEAGLRILAPFVTFPAVVIASFLAGECAGKRLHAWMSVNENELDDLC